MYVLLCLPLLGSRKLQVWLHTKIRCFIISILKKNPHSLAEDLILSKEGQQIFHFC